MAMRTVGLAIAALAALAAAGHRARAARSPAGPATTTAKAMPGFTAVTQAMLDGAAGDAKNWIHPTAATSRRATTPGNQINAEQRRRS